MVQYEFIKLPASQESSLQAQVIRHRDEALLSRGDFEIRHAERYCRFLADPTLRPSGPWPESARLFVPQTRQVLERLQGEIWQALFANMLNIRVVPFGNEDIRNAEYATQFLRWTLEKTLEWQQIAADLIFDALLDSVSVAKVSSWEPPWPPLPGPRFLRRQVKIDALDLGMLLVAPDAEGLQYPECRFVAQEFFLTEDDLLRLKRLGFDTPDTDQLGSSQQLTERKRVELEREGERVVEFRPESIPFVESYERFTLDDDLGEEDVIVSWFPDSQMRGTSHNTESNHGRIAGVRRLIDVYPQDDRPRRPFFPVTFWGQPRQWRGLNVPDRLESMQDLINRLYEQLVNYGEVSMLPFVFVNTFLTGEIPDLRTVRPGSTVPIDDMSGVQFAPTRSLNRHFSEQIQMTQAHIERDSQVVDFQLRGQGQSLPRTASATLEVLGEIRKTYAFLVRGCAKQFSNLLAFDFRLWQEILPDDTYAQIAPAVSPFAQASSPETSTLWDRLFAHPLPGASVRQAGELLTALPISLESLSGFYDVTIDVNPEEQVERQILLSLYQVTAPAIQEYPLGHREMLKRLWTVFDQRGFDQIYPEELALLKTQQSIMAIQVQLATFEAQLEQMEQAKAQQQLANLERGAEEFRQTGKVSPELEQLAQTMRAPASVQGNGTTVSLE